MPHKIRLQVPVSLVVAILIAGCSPATVTPPPAASSSPSARPSPSSSQSASPVSSVPSAAASPSPIAAGWQLVPLPDQATIATVVDLAAGTGLLVAVGGAAPTGAPRAWSSTDGTTWVAEAIPADMRTPNRVVSWADRFLVTGAGSFNCAHPFALATWLRAADGTWAAAPPDPKFCVGGSADVAVQGGRAVMAGIGSGDVPFVWSSDDGLRWTDRAGAIQHDTAPRAVIADASGFTIFGSSQTGPWVAHSVDGATWTSEALPGNASVTILGAFEKNGQPAAVASSGSAVGVFSRGSDGTWKSDPARGLDAALVGRIVVVDGGLVALGGGDAGPAIRVSADGISWRSVELPAGTTPGTTLAGALINGGRAFLTGETEVGARSVGVIWTGPASLLTP